MSDEWLKVPLDSVARFQEGPGILAKDFEAKGVPLVRLAGLGGHEVTLYKCNYLEPSLVANKWDHFRLTRGDILVSTSASFGRPAVVGEEAEGSVFYTGIIRFRSKSPDLHEGYLKTFLGSHAFMLQAEAQASGSVIRHFGPSHLRRMEIPLPPWKAQKNIAHVHSVLDDKIDLNRRMNETLEAMARAIFKDWFVDFGPTRAKAEGRAPYLAAQHWELFPDVLDEEDKPEGWSFAPVTALAEMNPESWSRKNTPEEVEYVDLANTKWGTIEATQQFRWQDAPSRAKRILRPGDTIVGMVRPGNGSFAFVSDSGLTGSTGFAVLRPHQAQYTELVFLSATAPENIERLANLADGAAYPAVRPEVVGATEVAFCEDAVATSFSELVSPILDSMESNKRENHTLTQTRDLLLPKLMSGEIRLSNADKFVTDVA